MLTREDIVSELDAMERKKGVCALYSVESGSRCWGFASADSDYDIRVVYVRPRNDYLKLEGLRDTIEWRLDDEYDVVGWDLGKFLRLMRGSNPTVFEWLGSTIVYREAADFQKVRDVALSCFDPVAHAHHYLGMAAKNIDHHIKVGNATLKRYLYAVRATLACRWAVEEKRPVPMAFSELSEAMLEPELAPVVANMVEIKRSGLESDRQDPIPELDEWLCVQEELLREKIGTLEHPVRIEWSVLDEAFLKIVG
ncbi:MAG: nucleotidyltransferase domain-containing protein [Atopobiaceae bacterium]|nr:nucleotidyltransferase domain-containing protein [Atopobiaceae bacterium]